jgi:serine/threonine-protein kinase
MPKTCPTCNVSYEDGSIFCPADGSTLRAVNVDQDDLIGTVIADRYLLTDKLGEGGMGRVYLGHHVRVPRQAAIKVLRNARSNDYDVVAAFNREANNAARMGNHRHVAEVYDFGETADGLIYLAMEYVEGESLSTLLLREPVLAPKRAVEIVRQIAEALTVAHELPVPVIHRDLKPDNIMLARNRDGSDCVKVVDFGIAKAIAGETQKLTTPGLAVGTPKYMSPEQLTAVDALDARSDIYSLGLIAFQMLTGKMPFQSTSAAQEFTLQWSLTRLTSAPIPIAQARGDRAWPAGLQAVFDRALALSPEERYASAEMFARDLVAAIEQLDAPAPRRIADTTPVVAERPRRAPRIALGAGAVALLAGVLAITLRSRDDRPPRGSPAEVARADTPALKQAAGGDIARPAASPGADASAADPGSAPMAPDSGRVVAQSVPTSTPATSIRPADTTGTGSPGERAADPASASRAALDSIDKLLSGQSSPTGEQATQILETLRRIRPDLTPADDLRAQLYAAEALLVFGQTADACKLLRAVDRDGVGTDVGRVAHRYLNPPPDSSGVLRLKCPE